MRHTRPNSRPPAQASSPESPAPAAPVYATNRGALVKCGLLLAVTVGAFFYFKPDAQSDPLLPSVTAAPPAATPAPVDGAAPAALLAKADTPPPAGALIAPENSPEHSAAKSAKKEKEKGKEKKDEVKQDRREQDEFFAAQKVPRFMINFIPEEWEYLKKDARRYAEATLIDLDTEEIHSGVAVKCKGSAGSFQQPDQRPGLSISLNKYRGAERWHGFLKWHLNNGAQDASLLNEQISCEMARAAGVPASRCAHALLKWQGRDLGLYLFKEAFDQDFLAHFYKNPEGDLYDGGFVHEIDLNTEKDQGEPMQKENLRELIAAAQEPNQEKRWARLEKILDIDEYLSFTAIESITCHWDGYNFNRNNYRFYFDVATGKAQFFLHGTDQTFGDPNFPVTRDSGSMVGQAVLSNPAWKKAYREHVEKIYQEVLKPVDWPARVTEIGEKVKAGLAAVNPQLAKDYEGRIVDTRNRVTARLANIAKQLGDLPKPFNFDANGVAKLSPEGWQPQGAAAAVDTAVRDGRTCFHIRTEAEAAVSWRKTISLEKGKYRFEVSAATAGVVGTKSPSGEGAGVRISGGLRVPPDNVIGDTGWQEVGYDIETQGGDVVLVAELRASKGEVWFDRDSFRLRQVK